MLLVYTESCPADVIFMKFQVVTASSMKITAL
jgi:hypothetical protein